MELKRVIDLLGSLLGITVFWPVMLFVGFAVKVDTPGPIVFSQNRVGRGERTFRCHKFRSMYVSAPERPTHDSIQADVTRVGRILRRTKLDELPQLVNVLFGEMSLVGPRPCLPSQNVLIEARRRLGVNELRPGITGLAQVNGIDMSEPEQLARVDAIYAANANALMDLRIIIASLPGGGWLRPTVGT